MKIGGSISGALFSDDGKRRLALWRVWDKTKPAFMFDGLNPSTANGVRNDPTILHLIGWGKLWGYGGLYAGNISDLISSDPHALLRPEAWLNREQNAAAISAMVKFTTMRLVGWGEWGSKFPKEVAEMLDLLGKPVYCLKVNKSGEPVHPLYQPYSSKLKPYMRLINQ